MEKKEETEQKNLKNVVHVMPKKHEHSDLKRHVGHYFKQKWTLSISLVFILC